MRKYILFLVLILASCTPQRQLARLLARHPELKRDSIIVIHDTIVTPYVQSSTVFTLEDLNDMLQMSSAHDSLGSSNADIKTGITAIADHARASIVADYGQLRLIAEQLPDTTPFQHKAVIPTYTTEIQKIPTPIPSWKVFLMYLGGIFIIELLLRLVVFILKKNL
ncbi:MAG: hypothetical protein PHR62_14180 [Paludibacter sp.]|nr:hypothetical protein [Paludibacter sp.]